METQSLEEKGGVELDVGLQAPAGLVFFEETEGDFLDMEGQGVQVVVAILAVVVLPSPSWPSSSRSKKVRAARERTSARGSRTR